MIDAGSWSHTAAGISPVVRGVGDQEAVGNSDHPLRLQPKQIGVSLEHVKEGKQV